MISWLRSQVNRCLSFRILKLANAARDQRDWRVAAELYESYLISRPENAAILVQYGHCLKEDNRPCDAVRAYRRALQQRPDLLEARLHLAHCLKNTGQLADALSEFLILQKADAFLDEVAIETRISIPQRYAILGDEYRQQRSWHNAAEAYFSSLRLAPDNSPLWVQLGHALKEQQRLEEAISAYREATKRAPKDAEAWLHLAHLLRRTGPRVESLNAFAMTWVLGNRDLELIEALKNAAGYSLSDIQEAIYFQAREIGADLDGIISECQLTFSSSLRTSYAHIDDGYLRQFDFVYLSGIDWGYRWQRPQQMTCALANRGQKVLFVSTVFGQTRETPSFVIQNKYSENITEIRLQISDDGAGSLHYDLSSAACTEAANAINAMCEKLCTLPVVIIVDHPAWGQICKSVQRAILVYDCIDNIAAFTDTSTNIIEAERELIQNANIVTATSRILAHKIMAERPVFLIPNGVETDHFAKVAGRSFCGTKVKIIYFGLIASWFNWEWVELAAISHPEWTFLLIGEVTTDGVLPLRQLSNIEFLGEVPYSNLPYFLEDASAAIVPFYINELTASVSPIKAYEYLASGRPVVASDMPELRQIPCVQTVESAQGFVKALEMAIKSDTLEQRAMRSKWALEHDWSKRADQLIAVLNNCFQSERFFAQPQYCQEIKKVANENKCSDRAFPFQSFILFVAPFPKPDLVVEGWMGRIRAIDEIFGPIPRIYLHFSSSVNPDESPISIQHLPQAYEFYIHPASPMHLSLVGQAMELCKFCYVHTIHLAKYVVGFYPTGKIITDFHGIVPEEEEMMGNPEGGRFYEGIECTVLQCSRYIVVVTHSMAKYLRGKYPFVCFEEIVLPVIVDYNQQAPVKQNKHADDLSIIYSGGSQVWQNVDAMLSAIAASKLPANYQIASHDHAIIKHKAQAYGLEDQLKFAVYSRDELPAFYNAADFGFVLRDDTAVNRVACPTKLTEYMEFGIIPIVRLVEIGDFATEGYEYVTEEEFREGLIPGRAQRMKMMDTNREVLRSLRARFSRAAEILKKMDLPCRIPSGELSGLPTFNMVGLMPWKREVYIFGTKTTYLSSIFNISYNTADFACIDSAEGDLIRIVPMVGDFVARINEVIISVGEVEAVKPVVVQSRALHLSSGDYFAAEAPFFEIKLSSSAIIKNVHVNLEFAQYGPMIWKTAISSVPGDNRSSQLKVTIKTQKEMNSFLIASNYV